MIPRAAFWKLRIRARRLRRGLTWQIDRADRVLLRQGFPFHIGAAGAPASLTVLRRAARRRIRDRIPGPLHPLGLAVMAAGWPFGALGLALRALREHPGIAAQIGGGRSRALATLWWMAVRHNAPPIEAAEYDLARRRDRPIDAWLFEHEITRLLASLADGPARRVAGSKFIFSEFCATEGLPGIPILGYWHRGIEHRALCPGAADCIVLKPVGANNAYGLEQWWRDGTIFRAGDAKLTAGGLADHARHLSLTLGGYLAQPLQRAHPALIAAGIEGSPATRMLTGRWPDGGAELLDAVLSVPTPGRLASNLGQKWPICPVTGRVLPTATRYLPKWPKAPLDGLVLPGWAEAVDAVVRGHRRFPGQVAVLGWDVGFTAAGPVLIETNIGISFKVHQSARQAPRGDARAGELLGAWLTRPAIPASRDASVIVDDATATRELR